VKAWSHWCGVVGVLALIMGFGVVKSIVQKMTDIHREPTAADLDSVLAKGLHATRTMIIRGEPTPCEIDIKNHQGTVTCYWKDGTNSRYPFDVCTRNGKVIYRYRLPDGSTSDYESDLLRN